MHKFSRSCGYTFAVLVAVCRAMHEAATGLRATISARVAGELNTPAVQGPKI